jgi:Spy/CpxP family protein refolding chaperone
MLNRSKLWATGLLVAMFVTGVAVGGGMSRVWVGNGDSTGEGGQDGTDRERPSYVERLTTHLELTESQQDEVKSILAQRESDMAEFWQEVRPKFDAMRDTIRTKIMDVLTEEQQQKYGELLEHGSRRGERDRENRTHN